MHKNNRILIADEMHESLSGMLIDSGFSPDYQPLISRIEILQILKNYEGIIIRSKTILDKAFFEAAPNLRFVGRAGAGMDLIDIKEAENHKVALVNAPEGNRDAVGEHVIGLILCLFNKINLADNQIRNKIWKREANRGVELKGKTIAIIGYGNNGMATAKKLSGFDCKVIAYDKYKTNFDDQFVSEATMVEIFEQTDILSFHAPLTEETKLMMNASFIDQFKKPFYFINAARGEMANLNAILSAIKSGKILGACLDVLENEKLQSLSKTQEEIFNQLKLKENIIFTPHVAGWTQESYIRINEVLVDKITRLALD